MVKGTEVEWGTCSHIVSLNRTPMGFSYQDNTIAVGLKSGDIGILDAITGSQKATLSGHTDNVRSVAFCYIQIPKESGHCWEQKVGGSGVHLADSY